MARLFSAGAELQTAATGASDLNFKTVGTVSIATTGQRSGSACYTVVKNSAQFAIIYANIATTVGSDYYVRTALNLSALPAGIHSVCFDGWNGADTGGQRGWSVYVNGAGNIGVNDGTAGQVFQSTNTPIAAGTWYVVEVHFNQDATGLAGSFDLRLSGTTIYSSTSFNFIGVGVNNTTQSLAWGNTTGTADGFVTLSLDDIAVNDTSGGNQNSWCGKGQLILLKPGSDNSRTGFTTGSGSTTNLYNAANNVPPAGQVSPGTNISQIIDGTSNTTDNYVANLQTAIAKGAPSNADIVLVQVVVSHGNSSTTSRTNGISSTANPVIAEATGVTGTTAAGAWPLGWTSLFTPYTYAPTMDLTTGPTIKFRKGTASTDNSMAAFLGMLVEYVPATHFTSADTTVTSDADTRHLVVGRTGVDTTVASDTATRAATQAHTSADTTVSTDTITRLLAFLRTSSDVTVSSDLTTRQTSKVRSVTDTTTSSDLVTRVTPISRNLSDTTTTSDTLTRLLRQLRTTSDTSVSSDISTRPATIFRTSSDTTISSDSVTRIALAWMRIASDIATLTDASVALNIRPRTATDSSLNATDSAIQSAIRVRLSSDTTTSLDSAVRAALARARTTVDVATVTDASVALNVRLRTTADSSLNASDNAVQVFSRARAVNDTVTLSDSALRAALARVRTSIDTTTLTDSPIALSVRLRTTTDSSINADSAVQAPIHMPTGVDVSLLIDGGMRTFVRNRVTNDVTNISDTSVRQSSSVRVSTDILGLSDFASFSEIRIRSATDLTSLVDVAHIYIVLLTGTHDTSVTSDALNRYGLIYRQANDVSISNERSVIWHAQPSTLMRKVYGRGRRSIINHFNHTFVR